MLIILLCQLLGRPLCQAIVQIGPSFANECKRAANSHHIFCYRPNRLHAFYFQFWIHLHIPLFFLTAVSQCFYFNSVFIFLHLCASESMMVSVSFFVICTFLNLIWQVGTKGRKQKQTNTNTQKIQCGMLACEHFNNALGTTE